MRVALDVTPTITGVTGVARYVTFLIGELRSLGVDVQPFAIGRGIRRASPGTRRVRAPLRVVHRAWRTVGHPRIEALVGPADVVHATDLIVPPSHLPVVATVHDLHAIAHPQHHPRRAVAVQRAQLRSLARATRICTNSQATADELVGVGVDEARIVVTPLGHEPVSPGSLPARVPDEPFVLVVGELHRRKGVPLAVEAVAALEGVHLVHAGPEGEAVDAVDATAARLGISSRVHRLGRLDDGELAAVMACAAVLCSPSYAEGFGLPLLEGMAAGVPVVATDLPASREVADDAAVLVPVGDAIALQDALGALLADPDRRRRLGAAGLERARGFTWRATAEATLAAYDAALCSA